MSLRRDPETGQIQEAVSPDAILELFEDLDLPFVSSKMIADEFGCTTQTARNKLGELVTESELERVELDSRRIVYIHPDYATVDEVANALRQSFDLGEIDTDALAAFADEPYCLLPKGEREAYVIVPRFVPFHVGYLDRQTESYNVFVVNKYFDWIYDLPEDIRGDIGISAKYNEVTVADEYIEITPDDREEAWEEFDQERHQNAIPPDSVLSEMEWDRLRGLASRLGVLEQGMDREEVENALAAERDDGRIRINKSAEFDAIAKLIEDGNLPFAPSPVDDQDMRNEPPGVELDDPDYVPAGASYQTRAWKQFKETGMVGVYWPPSAGKTFIALYAGDRLVGSKLVVVPNNTLKEQWQDRINELCRNPNEWDIQTYQYLRGNIEDYEQDGPMLTIFDEHHHLPADTYAKLGTIDTKYRMGLSASPYREDERVDYIFALSGYPVGLNWDELVALGVVDTPPAKLFLYQRRDQKARDLEDLISERAGKILILCDSIDEGQELSEQLSVPFIYGETTNRMEKFENNRIVIGSRVADEGLSLEDLDVVIQYDFHGSSRRQEIQRYGRVMHGNSRGEYIIQMSDTEYDKFSDRLLSLEEQGINIVPERRI